MVVPPQDVLPKNAEPVMPSAPGIPDPQTRQLELATGGVVNRENYRLGSDFIKNLYKTKPPGVVFNKNISGSIRISSQQKYKDKINTETKSFDPKTSTQQEVTKFVNKLKNELKKVVMTPTEKAYYIQKARIEHTNLKKNYTIEVMDWLDEASSNPKYKNREQIQEDLS